MKLYNIAFKKLEGLLKNNGKGRLCSKISRECRNLIDQLASKSPLYQYLRSRNMPKFKSGFPNSNGRDIKMNYKTRQSAA